MYKRIIILLLGVFLLLFFWVSLKPSISIKNESPYKVWIYDMQYRKGILVEEYSYEELDSLAKPYTSLEPNQSITFRLKNNYLFEKDNRRLLGIGWSYSDPFGKRHIFTETFTLKDGDKCGIEYIIKDDGYEKTERKWPFICLRRLGESFQSE